MKRFKNILYKFKEQKAKFDINIFISLLPVTILILVILIYPLISVFYHGFTEWKIGETSFIGLDNYKNLIFSKAQLGSLTSLLKNNFILLLAIPIQLFLSLFIAYLLHEEIWGWKVFRILFYLPAVIPVIVIGYFIRLFSSINGPLNQIFKVLHLDFLTINWLNQGFTAMILIIIALIWHSYGMAVLIFLSGMSSIEPAILESSLVDGANWWQRFFRIVIPMIVNTIEFYLVILLIGFFTASFNFIYSITSGGPGYSTTTIEYMIYLKAFETQKLGQSAALSTMLFFLVLIMVIIIIKLFRKIGEWQE